MGAGRFAGRHLDPAARDVDTLTIRETVRTIREAEEWTPAIIPSGDGLLVAVTEQRSRADIDRLAEVLGAAVAAEREAVTA